MQQLADRALVQRDVEAGLDQRLQVDPPPAHHAIAVGIGAAHPWEHHARVSPSGPACRPGPRPSAEPDQVRRESWSLSATWPVAIPTRRRDKNGPLRAEGRNPARRVDGLHTDQPHGQDHPGTTLGADGAHPPHGHRAGDRGASAGARARLPVRLYRRDIRREIRWRCRLKYCRRRHARRGSAGRTPAI